VNGFVTAVLVALGGSTGAVSRVVATRISLAAGAQPWMATLGVNLLGCFVMGWAFVVLEARFRAEGSSQLASTPHFPRLQEKGWTLGDDPTLPTVDLFRANQNLRFLSGLVMTGCLGSFTTFSAFSLETLQLIEAAHLVPALLTAALSIGLSIAAVSLGLHIGRGRLPER